MTVICAATRASQRLYAVVLSIMEKILSTGNWLLALLYVSTCTLLLVRNVD